MNTEPQAKGWLESLIGIALRNKPVLFAICLLALFGSLRVAPFDFELGGLERDPVPVDAIPDLGENQQIVFTTWPGHSPRDIEDQITYPLSSTLLGVADVRTVRALSMFGFSTIYVIFEEEAGFYDSRSRLLEKLASLPPDLLPQGVRPALGPDATALGQVFWYTLEGRDAKGEVAGGWDLHELRSIQDWTVRPALLSVEGVAEVASVGGHTREIIVEADPLALKRYEIGLQELYKALSLSGEDSGGGSVEINQVEYLIRGRGFLRSVEDVGETVVAMRGGQALRVSDLAHVSEGPAPRRGALDKDGVEAVGGVVVARYGANPKAVIQGVKERIHELEPGLPVRETDAGRSRVSIVPFYDRSTLIDETIATLFHALLDEILVTALVILVMVRHLRSSLLIAALLPAAVLLAFIAMKQFGVDANIVALSGIAIAIGTMVDMGIVICEAILSEKERRPTDAPLAVVERAVQRVARPVLTALATTVVSFLPVFSLQAAEGKLFTPLAWTKTFSLVAALVLALFVLPALAQLLFFRRKGRSLRRYTGLPALGLTAAAGWYLPVSQFVAVLLLVLGLSELLRPLWERRLSTTMAAWFQPLLVMALALSVLSEHWLPMGGDSSPWLNLGFSALLLASFLSLYYVLMRHYETLLRRVLHRPLLFMVVPALLVACAGWIWSRTGSEFMPALDEGSFLYMPSTMPHASIGEVLDVLAIQDQSFRAIPEIREAVGKLGRVDSPLDPAPLSMIETVIQYHPSYLQDENGHRTRWSFDPAARDTFRNAAGEPVPAADGRPYLVQGRFERDGDGQLVADSGGRFFPLWRPPLDPELNEGRDAWPGIRDTEAIWQEILAAGEVTGVTSAPKLQPISTRLVMLQSGMRAPMGIKIQAPDLPALERAALAVEESLREVPEVYAPAVVADRVIGKPYLELSLDRSRLRERGVTMDAAQRAFSAATGGAVAATLYEGRERTALRLRFPRELRDSPEDLEAIPVKAMDGRLVPLAELGHVEIVRGPQVLKSEDTFLTGYVLFDGRPGLSDGEVVSAASEQIEKGRADGSLKLPAGVQLRFAGTWENQLRAQKRLLVVIPVALVIIMTLLWLQFRRLRATLLVFSGIAVAFAGAFVLLWLWSQPWFLDVSLADRSLRELFGMKPIFLSVAVWVGFLALFGLATDDGVLMTTCLDQSWSERRPVTRREQLDATVAGARLRIRACLMTTATTVLALLPVLGSSGRGADVMVPMAIPVFGGMLFEAITVFTVPVLYYLSHRGRVSIGTQ